MQVRRKNVCVFVNSSVLYNCLSTSLYVEQLVQAVIQKIDLQVEAPSWHVFIKIEQVRVMINVFELGYPLVVFAEQLGEGGFTCTYITRNRYMFRFFAFCHLSV